MKSPSDYEEVPKVKREARHWHFFSFLTVRSFQQQLDAFNEASDYDELNDDPRDRKKQVSATKAELSWAAKAQVLLQLCTEFDATELGAETRLHRRAAESLKTELPNQYTVEHKEQIPMRIIGLRFAESGKDLSHWRMCRHGMCDKC